MKRAIRWVGRLTLALVLLASLVLVVLAWLLGSDGGFRFLGKQIDQRFDAVQLSAIDGNLYRGIAGDQLSIDTEALSIRASGLSSEWQLSCLLQRAFCLDQLTIDELLIRLTATESIDTEATDDTTLQLPSIHLPIDVRIDELRIRRLRLQPPGDAPEQLIDDINLSAQMQGSEMTLNTVSLQYQQYSARASGRLALTDDYPVDLNLAVDAPDLLPDSLPDGEGEQPGRLEIELDDTIRSLKLQAALSGLVEAQLEGRLSPLDPDLPATLELRSGVLGWPLVSRSQLRLDGVVLSAEGTLDDYRIRLGADASGISLPDTRIDIAGRVNNERAVLPEIDIRTLGGTASAHLEASWLDGIDWQTRWQLANIDPSQQYPEINGSINGNVSASGRVSDGDWTLSLPSARFDGTLQDYPFSLDASLARGRQNAWQIGQLRLNNEDNRIDVRGQVGERWDLTADVTLPQLQTLLPSLSGELDAALAVSGPLSTPDITLQASSQRASFNQIDIDGISINADVNRLFNDTSRVVLAIGTLRAAEQTLSNTRLVLDGSRDRHTLTLFADGPHATAIDLLAGGSLNEHFDWSGVLDRVELEVPAHDIVLNQPTALSWNQQLKKLSVDAHCWVTEGSRLCLENPVVAEASGKARVTLDRYALQRLNPFLPAESSLQGELRMSMDLAWGEDLAGGLAATLSSEIADGGASVLDAAQNPIDFRYEYLRLDAQLEPDNIDASLSLRSENLGQADVHLSMNPASEDKAIDGLVTLDGLDIGIAQAFLPDIDQISGTLSVDGSLQGQLGDPRFEGTVQLSDPVLQAENLPLPLTGGDLTASIRGKRAVLDGSLQSGDGRITVDGSANWQVIDAWRVDVELDGEDLNVQSEPLQESSVSHRLRIGARPGLIRVDGNIEIPMARIDVADLPQGAARVSDDVVIIEDEAEQQSDAASAASDTRVQVTIAINLGEDVTLSAYGLDAQLTGDMSLRLNTPRPVQLGGEISVVEGVYRKYGQDLEANGQILFVGPVNQTRLAIDAVREIETEDRIAGLRIQGTVASPEITLFSEPDDKSEDAILSYIVLGRDINEASDQEANLLSAAALALTVRGGRTIGSGIADKLGVEDFALETRGSGDDTELVVSGRLNDRLLLRYGRSVFEPSSTLYLRYDLTKKLYLEAAQGAERAVDLFYSFSF